MAKDQKETFRNGSTQCLSNGLPEYTDSVKQKAETDHKWGYYSKLVNNYPVYEEEVAHTSHIAKEHPDWKAV